MLALQIDETKEFMNHLLKLPTFDFFSMQEATISTSFTSQFDGHINRAFYSSEELEQSFSENQLYLPWKELKPICFQLVRGTHTPLQIKITLSFPIEKLDTFLHQTHLSLTYEQIDGLFINIRFQGQQIMCTTATSLSFFTLDKSLEHEWDQYVLKFFKDNNIASTQLK